jgi:hypothetical protein
VLLGVVLLGGVLGGDDNNQLRHGDLVEQLLGVRLGVEEGDLDRSGDGDVRDLPGVTTLIQSNQAGSSYR